MAAMAPPLNQKFIRAVYAGQKLVWNHRTNPPLIVVSSTMWTAKDARNAHRSTSRLVVHLLPLAGEHAGQLWGDLIWPGVGCVGLPWSIPPPLPGRGLPGWGPASG